MASSCSQKVDSPFTGTFFEHLSPRALDDLASLQHTCTFGSNIAVFSEMDEFHGLYILLNGEIRLSISSTDGRRLSLRIARRGDIIGLSSVLSGLPYDVTAQTLYPVRLACIGRQEFLGFLARHPEAYAPVLQDLSRTLVMTCDQLRTVGLASSAPEKLARLLLRWSEHNPISTGTSRTRFPLTHEEIGEFIGASRETVTRTLKAFKVRNLVSFQGSILTITNPAGLAVYARA
jgi:CRP/FNR family transcriptional regulator, cyclic AMP receptor protein